MTPVQLCAAFGIDLEALRKDRKDIQLLMHVLDCDQATAYRILGRPLVPILKAFRVKENYPDKFPAPIDWKLWEAEEKQRYASRAKPSSQRKKKKKAARKR